MASAGHAGSRRCAAASAQPAPAAGGSRPAGPRLSHVSAATPDPQSGSGAPQPQSARVPVGVPLGLAVPIVGHRGGPPIAAVGGMIGHFLWIPITTTKAAAFLNAGPSPSCAGFPASAKRLRVALAVVTGSPCDSTPFQRPVAGDRVGTPARRQGARKARRSRVGSFDARQPQPSFEVLLGRVAASPSAAASKYSVAPAAPVEREPTSSAGASRPVSIATSPREFSAPASCARVASTLPHP
jgi:hypothetical protein